MRKILAIAWNRLVQFFKQPVAWILMMVMPILFTAIFGSLLSDDIVNNRPHVALVGGEDVLTQEVIRLLTQNDQFAWVKMDAGNAEKEVKERQVIAAVIIEDDIIERLERSESIFNVMVQQKSGDYLTFTPVVNGIGRLIQTSYDSLAKPDAQTFATFLSSISRNGTLEIQYAKQNEETALRYVDLSSLGFTIMFMMFGISTAASSILEERREGTWARLLTTPTRKVEIILGYLLSFFLMGWLQFGILMVATSIFFGVNWGNLFVLIPFSSLLIITVVGFGLMMAGLVKSRQQAGALSAIVIVSTCMIGGVYWPLEITPNIMQLLAKVVPQSWAIAGFQEIVGGSMNVLTLATSSIILLLFAVVFLSIGIKRLKFE